MKSLFVSVVLVFATLSSSASNYPPEYFYQNVRLLPLGANAFVAQVSSGIMSKVVLGYKKSGPLAGNNPDYIDTVVEIKCSMPGGGEYNYRNVIRIGKEWSGHGYLSGPTEIFPLGVPSNCGDTVAVAFSDGQNHWDSLGGANYRVSRQDFFNGKAALYQTNEAGRFSSDEINDKAWQYLIQSL